MADARNASGCPQKEKAAPLEVGAIGRSIRPANRGGNDTINEAIPFQLKRRTAFPGRVHFRILDLVQWESAGWAVLQ